jgi:cobalt-zinc-cadmium efflux system outer membrane protein
MRRMGRPAWIVSAIALLGPYHAVAAAVQLTMDEAVTRAISVNPDPSDLQIAQAQLLRGEALVPSNPLFGVGTQSASATTSNINGIVSSYFFFLQQELEIAGQRGKRIDAARQGVEEKTWEQKHTQQVLAATVKSTFVHALINGERLVRAQQHLDATRALAEELTPKGATNDVQRIDRNNAQILQVRAERGAAATERQRDDSLSTLRQLTGIAPHQPVDLVGAPRSEFALPALETLVARALRDRPDLVAARHAAQKADLEVSVQERARIPNITLFGSVSKVEKDVLFGGDLAFPIPVFHSGSTEVMEAVAERTHATAEQTKLERSVEDEVAEVYRTVQVAADDLTAYKTLLVPLYEENLEMEHRLYARAQTDVSSVMDSESDLFGVRGEYLDALERYNDALIELERVVGGAVTAENGAAPGSP